MTITTTQTSTVSPSITLPRRRGSSCVSDRDDVSSVPLTNGTIGSTSKRSVSVLSRIYWVHVFVIFGLPLFGAYLTLYASSLHIPSPSVGIFCFAFFYYFFTGLGIGSGYHRLFSHRAYKANKAVEAVLMSMGSGALQGSVQWWSLKHRLHHRYTDSVYDPYNITNGFWYAHIGWMLLHGDERYKRHTNIDDLQSNPLLKWQNKHYVWFGPFMSLGVPAIVGCLLFNDAFNGFLYAGIWRQVFLHHCTFAINSIAHYYGNRPFDDSRTARDCYLTAIFTFGEGYHNFHHSFPSDYRNGIRWFDYDPSKWLINALWRIGWVTDLKISRDEDIDRVKREMKEKVLQRAEAGKGTVKAA